MMRIAMFAVVLMMLVVGSDPAAADIYKYRDAQGVVRYTYDLAEVPEDQRPQVQTYEETVGRIRDVFTGEDGAAQMGYVR